MNGSASLLDYGLIDAGNVSNITSFVIDEQARYACGSDHALLECELQYSAKRVIKWKFSEIIKYNFKESTNFAKYKEALNDNIKNISLTKFSSLSTSERLPHLTNTIKDTALQVFGLKKNHKKLGNCIFIQQLYSSHKRYSIQICKLYKKVKCS